MSLKKLFTQNLLIMGRSYLLLVSHLLFFGLTEIQAKESKPNVVVIFIDDQGYYDLGCYGATEVKTPRIDQMAKEGIRFTDYYAAAPICSPSRAGLLTGAYPRRIGMETWVQRADSNRGIHSETRIKWDDAAKTLSIEPASKQKATRAFQVELIPDGGTKKIQYTGQRLELKF
jgi:hypothetical protein